MDEEAGRLLAHFLVCLRRQFDGLFACRVCAFAYERQPSTTSGACPILPPRGGRYGSAADVSGSSTFDTRTTWGLTNVRITWGLTNGGDPRRSKPARPATSRSCAGCKRSRASVSVICLGRHQLRVGLLRFFASRAEGAGLPPTHSRRRPAPRQRARTRPRRSRALRANSRPAPVRPFAMASSSQHPPVRRARVAEQRPMHLSLALEADRYFAISS
jgi:hypothetical protein